MKGLEMPARIGCLNTISKGVHLCLLFGVFWIFVRVKGKASGHLNLVSWQIFPNFLFISRCLCSICSGDLRWYGVWILKEYPRVFASRWFISAVKWVPWSDLIHKGMPVFFLNSCSALGLLSQKLHFLQYYNHRHLGYHLLTLCISFKTI